MKMESNPTTTPTIAELWREFQKTLKHKPAMYISHAAHKGIEVTRYAKHISEAATKYTALRAQLIERYEKAGFSIHASGSLNVPEFYGSADDADEYIACMSAVQWEARQREKEIQP